MKHYEVNVAARGSSYMNQIIAGFTILSQQEKLTVSFRERRSLADEFYQNGIVEILSDGKRIICDLADGYNNFPSLSCFEECVGTADFYFKANCKAGFHHSLHNKEKILPLAPRYAATIRNSWNNAIDLKKTNVGLQLAKELLWHIPGTRHAISDYYYDRFEEEPRIVNKQAKVFFYTRLWDPSIASGKSSKNIDIDGKTEKERIEKKAEEYLELSQLRADLVKALKTEFGNRFVGGIAPDSYTVKAFSELLGPDLSQRRVYTAQMHSSEICVNTWGTHKCFNFSFGEELASSRAIVSQRAFYDLPAHLTEGMNFQSYDSVEGCIQIVHHLMEHPEAVARMMQNNREYYIQHLRPDSYVLDILKTSGVEP
ncbi:MAG: hypothetical protein J6A79_13680 [Clostridia bacterium]|nr:hypothetical protein [Clostridia bacterium]